MGEPIAGLVISGIGLVTLADQVTALFGRIDSGRNLGDDYERYITQLEMARLAYMQWLEAVKITEPSGSSGAQIDLSASNKQSAETLKRILGLIEAAFAEAEKKGAIYKIDQSQKAFLSTSSKGATDVSCLGDDFRERADARQKSIPFRNKIRWALKDKKALEELVTKVSESVKDLNKSFPAVSKTVTEDDVRSIADPRDAQNLPRLELMKNVAAHTDPVLERSVDQAIIEGHTYHNMQTGNKVKALFGNQVFEGNVDPAWARRRNQYSDGKASGTSQVMYGDQINPPKSFWD